MKPITDFETWWLVIGHDLLLDENMGIREIAHAAWDGSRALSQDSKKPLRCPGCGELKLEETLYCTKCGTDLPSR